MIEENTTRPLGMMVESGRHSRLRLWAGR